MQIVRQLMSERKISFRLNPENTKLFEEYKKKFKAQTPVSDSQIFRAGLQFLMSIPEIASNEQVLKVQQEIDQIVAEMNERLKTHPDPKLHELWQLVMAKQKEFLKASGKSIEKFSFVIGDGKAGRKPDPNKKHIPGRIPDSEKGSPA